MTCPRCGGPVVIEPCYTTGGDGMILTMEQLCIMCGYAGPTREGTGRESEGIAPRYERTVKVDDQRRRRAHEVYWRKKTTRSNDQMVPRVCEICAVEFMVSEKSITRGIGRVCSHACAGKLSHQRKRPS